MERILPTEVLTDIFLTLPVRDIISVSQVCKYWQGIVDQFIWKKVWGKLLGKMEESAEFSKTVRILKSVNTSNIDLFNACTRLSDAFFDSKDMLCVRFHGKYPRREVILKTHHSQLKTYVYTADYDLYPDVLDLHVDIHRREDEPFTMFRTTDNILKNLQSLLYCTSVYHIYYGTVIYSYPLALHVDLKEVFVKFFFELCQFRNVVFIPRVLMLCEHLGISDAVVVYSSSHSTEVAVVLDGQVAMNRWCELTAGGWQVAEQLYSAYQWIHPTTNLKISTFNSVVFKQECFLSIYPAHDRKRDVASKQVTLNSSSGIKTFTLKHERYLAAEVMYTQLNLASIIYRLLQGLPAHVKSNCLSHILLTGGNCQMKNFNLRLKRDLVRELPEYEYVIAVSVHDGRLCYSHLPNLFKSDLHSKCEAGRKVGISLADYIIGNF